MFYGLQVFAESLNVFIVVSSVYNNIYLYISVFVSVCVLCMHLGMYLFYVVLLLFSHPYTINYKHLFMSIILKCSIYSVIYNHGFFLLSSESRN